MRTTLFVILFVGVAACDDQAAAPAKDAGKTETSKKTVKIPPAKAEIKGDTKGDTKGETKADPAKDPAVRDPETPPDPSSDEAAKIVELARLARAIAAAPENADAILEKAGMDRSAFETQMLAVAKDQWRTDLYLTALTGADRAAASTGAG